MDLQEYRARIEESQQEILHRIFFTDNKKNAAHQVSGQLFLLGESLLRKIEEESDEQANG